MFRSDCECFVEVIVASNYTCQDLFPGGTRIISIDPATISEFNASQRNKFFDACLNRVSLILVPPLKEADIRSDSESAARIGLQGLYNGRESL